MIFATTCLQNGIIIKLYKSLNLWKQEKHSKGDSMLEFRYRVEKISKIKRVKDELFLLIFFLRGL